MIGQNVWRFMIDNEDVVRQNLEKAIRDQVDVRFEYHSTALDRWYEPPSRLFTRKKRSYRV
jgi:hypothetical protein